MRATNGHIDERWGKSRYQTLELGYAGIVHRKEEQLGSIGDRARETRSYITDQGGGDIE